MGGWLALAAEVKTALANGKTPQRSASATKVSQLTGNRRFSKGKLFGFDKARTVISREDQAVVVEGYFDVIALHAAGITNVVASLGTAQLRPSTAGVTLYRIETVGT